MNDFPPWFDCRCRSPPPSAAGSVWQRTRRDLSEGGGRRSQPPPRPRGQSRWQTCESVRRWLPPTSAPHGGWIGRRARRCFADGRKIEFSFPHAHCSFRGFPQARFPGVSSAHRLQLITTSQVDGAAWRRRSSIGGSWRPLILWRCITDGEG